MSTIAVYCAPICLIAFSVPATFSGAAAATLSAAYRRGISLKRRGGDRRACCRDAAVASRVVHHAGDDGCLLCRLSTHLYACRAPCTCWRAAPWQRRRALRAIKLRCAPVACARARLFFCTLRRRHLFLQTASHGCSTFPAQTRLYGQPLYTFSSTLSPPLHSPHCPLPTLLYFMHLLYSCRYPATIGDMKKTPGWTCDAFAYAAYLTSLTWRTAPTLRCLRATLVAGALLRGALIRQ